MCIGWSLYRIINKNNIKKKIINTIYEAGQSADCHWAHPGSNPCAYENVDILPLDGLNKHMVRKYQIFKEQ
jgi:hypothetical protein